MRRCEPQQPQVPHFAFEVTSILDVIYGISENVYKKQKDRASDRRLFKNSIRKAKMRLDA